MAAILRGTASAVVLAAALAAAGCSRFKTLQRQAGAVGDEHARQVLGDALWHHGSLYTWAETAAIRATVRVISHAPEGDRQVRETWRLDAAGGRLRIERPDATIEVGARACRASAGGRPLRDPVALAEACGYGRAVRELLALPLALLGPGRRIAYAGREVGPGEARSWHRLRVTYAPSEGRDPADWMVVYVRAGTDEVESAAFRWADLPWAGPWRVEMGLWRKAGGLLLAHRWRFFWADDAGRRAGPLRMTIEIERAEAGP